MRPTERNKTWYQELKLHGYNDRFDWVAGASWFREKAGQTSQVDLTSDSVDSAAGAVLGLHTTDNGRRS